MSPHIARHEGFREELAADQRTALGAATLVGAALIALTFPMDLLDAPAGWPVLLGSRVLIITLLLAIRSSMLRRVLAPHVAAALVGLLTAVFLATGVVYTHGTESPWWTGYFLLFAAVSVITPLTLRQTAVVFALIVPVYPLAMFLFDALPPGGAPTAGRQLLVLGCAAVLGLVSARLVERIRIREHQARAELARRETFSTVKLLTSTLAHELVNPLSALRAALEELDDPRTTPEDRAELMALARKASDRVTEVIESLRQLGKNRDRTLTLADLREELDTALQLARECVPESIVIVRDYAVAPRILCQPRELGQVFLNLIVNAAQSMGSEGGWLTLIVKDLDEAVTVEIADTGPGISLDHKPRLFLPFFTTKSTGTGLGLWTSEAIVKAHGGRIEVDDVRPHGARFRVVLPKPAVAVVPAA